MRFVATLTAAIVLSAAAAAQPLDGTSLEMMPLDQGPGDQGPGDQAAARPRPRQSQPDRSTIETVQRQLKDRGYYDGPIDGLAGRQTIDAVREYQADKGMPVTGEISPAVIADLQPSALPMSPQAPVQQVRLAETPADMVGRGVHTIAGDRIGWLREVLAGPDGQPAQAVVAVEGRYGQPLGDVPVPWSMVADDLGLPAVVLPVTTRDMARAADGGPAPVATAKPIRDRVDAGG